MLRGISGDTLVGRTTTLSARAEGYGTGCGPANMEFAPDAEARPILGLVASATLHHSLTFIVGVVIGFSKQSAGGAALPLSLANQGLPGCNLLTSADFTGFTTTPVATSTLQLENALQLVASNGIDSVLGDT
ncbi:MAG: hypothetical protein ACI89X_003748 [Planctomycetota bacterium]|jgi:hypothetical protein